MDSGGQAADADSECAGGAEYDCWSVYEGVTYSDYCWGGSV